MAEYDGMLGVAHEDCEGDVGVIGGIDVSASGNVIVKVGQTDSMRRGWIKSAHITLVRGEARPDEALELIHRLEAGLEGAAVRQEVLGRGVGHENVYRLRLDVIARISMAADGSMLIETGTVEALSDDIAVGTRVQLTRAEAMRFLNKLQTACEPVID